MKTLHSGAEKSVKGNGISSMKVSFSQSKKYYSQDV